VRSASRALVTSVLVVRLVLAAAPLAASPPDAPCAAPGFHRLDFWLGEWELAWPANGDQPAGRGTNRIVKTLGGCVVEESFAAAGPSPLVGRSLSTYDAARKLWRQTWVDNEGSFLDFEGSLEKELSLVRRIGKDGSPALMRMSWTNVRPDDLDWRWESSPDGGRTWALRWLIHYVRKGTRPAPPALARANALFDGGRWAEAVPSFEEASRAAPLDGRSLFRLGFGLLESGRAAEAIPMFEASLAVGSPAARGAIQVKLAEARAAVGRPDAALDALAHAADAGFNQPGALERSARLAPLKDDPRFEAALRRVRLNRTPCTTSPESRQLDFWLGAWDVGISEGRPNAGTLVGTSREEKVEGGCVLVEAYAQPDGFSGRSLNFYDAALGRWRQTWADATGGVTELTGVFRDGAMRLEGESHTAAGGRVLRRMTLSPLGDGRVRQTSEASYDEGATWSPAYDYTYTRRAP
jgi:hypothetical protein